MREHLTLVAVSKGWLKTSEVFTLPQMTNQKTNFYLKAVADIAGLQRPLTHHMARHTCATTVLLDNDVPMEVTSRFLGHTSIRTTQVYGRITHQQLTRALRKVNR